MKHLFAYGTLMCEDIMRQVSGCHLSNATGILKGYSRWSVKNECFPAIVPDESGRVAGIIYLNVPAPAWNRLDRFEGDMYVRKLAHIMLSDGRSLTAETYVAKPEFRDHLAPSDWCFADFLRHGKEDFQTHYQGYEAL